MKNAYGDFTWAYEQALGRPFFKAVRELLDWSLESDPPSGERTHLDLACGSGLAMGYFRKRKFSSVGIDASLPMLTLARRHGKVAAFDMRRLALRRSFTHVTCLYDSLNHLMHRSELVATFEGVRSVMTSDSRFLFDMNHPEAYPAVWGATEPFVSSGKDHHLSMATSFSPSRKIGRAILTGWARRGGKKVPIDETHEQRSYSEREIVRSLRESGLRPLEMLTFDPFDPDGIFAGGGVKFFFVAAKV